MKRIQICMLAKYKELAEKEENIIFGGRLGEYKYYEMDATVASVLDKCDEVLQLWQFYNLIHFIN